MTNNSLLMSIKLGDPSSFLGFFGSIPTNLSDIFKVGWLSPQGSKFPAASATNSSTFSEASDSKILYILCRSALVFDEFSTICHPLLS